MRLPEELIRDLMSLGGHNVSSLSYYTGIEHMTLRRLLKGRTPLRADHIRRFAEVFGMSDVLFYYLLILHNPLDRPKRDCIISEELPELITVLDTYGIYSPEYDQFIASHSKKRRHKIAERDKPELETVLNVNPRRKNMLDFVHKVLGVLVKDVPLYLVLVGFLVGFVL